MIGLVNGKAVFMAAGATKTYFTAEIYDGSKDPVLVATTTMVIFSENSRSAVLMQFRGEAAIKRFTDVVKSYRGQGDGPKLNGIVFNGHLSTWVLPKDVDAELKYADALKLVEEKSEPTVLDGNITTVIIIDNFDADVVLTQAQRKTTEMLSGNPIVSVRSLSQFCGIVKTDTSIRSDGAKYRFGRSTSSASNTDGAETNSGDFAKQRFSVASVTQHGQSAAKLRVEIHGPKRRIDMFESILKNNHALMVQGTLVVYADIKNFVVHYAVWVSQYQVISIGGIEETNLGSIGEILADGDFAELTEIDDAEFWPELYSTVPKDGTTASSIGSGGSTNSVFAVR